MHRSAVKSDRRRHCLTVSQCIARRQCELDSLCRASLTSEGISTDVMLVTGFIDQIKFNRRLSIFSWLSCVAVIRLGAWLSFMTVTWLSRLISWLTWLVSWLTWLVSRLTWLVSWLTWLRLMTVTWLSRLIGWLTWFVTWLRWLVSRLTWLVSRL